MSDLTFTIQPLAQRKCMPCEQGASPMSGDEIDKLTKELGDGWRVENGHHISKQYTFKNFRRSLNFVNRIGELAEAEGHHPELCLSWGKVDINIWTHSVGGLTQNDFVLAAKISEMARN